MSILFENDMGAFLSMEHYLNNIMHNMAPVAPKINSSLFNILTPYKTHSLSVKKKKKNFTIEEEHFLNFEHEIAQVRRKYTDLLEILKTNGFLEQQDIIIQKNNTDALKIANFVYEESGKQLIKDALGSNQGPATVKTIQNAKFLFPANCNFFCKDIIDINNYLSNKQFDLILLDPPWWNKYIRRKRKKSSHAYEMMHNHDLKTIPIESLLHDSGLVVVWCTNSHQHLNYLIEEIFPKWNVSFIAKWYWLKVTVNGEPVCEFSKPPGKQPFEQIIIGSKNKPNTNIKNEKLLISVPSAIHSHKPPLTEVLQPFLPDNPKCLELFARYLLPNWTSYGNEVLRLQHESLYCKIK